MSRRKVLYKLILIGDQGVGKTAIMNRYVNNKFSTSYKSTIGADFLQKEVEVTENDQTKLATLQIWDTAGAERFQSLGVAFYRGSDMCFLIYDVNSTESFASLETRYSDFLKHLGSTDILFAVVGTKTDLSEPPYAVSKKKVEAWCKTKEIMNTFEVSSSGSADSLNAMFKQMTTYYMAKQGQKKEEPPQAAIQLEPVPVAESSNPFGFLKTFVDGIPNPITAFTDATATTNTNTTDTTTTSESPLSFFKNLIDSIPTPTFPTTTTAETETTPKEVTSSTAETDIDPLGFFKRLIDGTKTDEKPKTDT